MTPFSAFTQEQLIAEGELREVALSCKQYIDSHAQSTVLIFNNETSGITEVDLRGDEAAVLQWLDEHHPEPTNPELTIPKLSNPELGPPAPRGRGRPKLGVVSREVTLLPRHWDWLRQQPGSASVTLRRLVDTARSDEKHSPRHAQDLAYGFSYVMAGDLPGFEEATRALYAKDKRAFTRQIKGWPADIRRHVSALADGVWGA